MWKCRRVDSPDVRVPQTERQRQSGVTLALVCTYSVPPFLFASALKHCLSQLLSFLSYCFSSFLYAILSFFFCLCLSSVQKFLIFLSLSISLIYFSMLLMFLHCFCFYTHLFLNPSLDHFLISNSARYYAFSPPVIQVYWDLTLIVLMWRIGWAHNNARK